jgi:hypothetical protein
MATTDGADGSRLQNSDDWMERLQNAHHSDRLQQVTVHESRVQSFIARNTQSPFKTILADCREGAQKASCANKAQFTRSPLLFCALRLLHIEGSACTAWLPYKPLIVGLQKTSRFSLALIGESFQEVFGGAVDGTAQPRSQLFFRCQRLKDRNLLPPSSLFFNQANHRPQTKYGPAFSLYPSHISSKPLTISSGNGPPSQAFRFSSSCSTLLAPRMIPSPSPSGP